jgi:hypothetical protein
VEDRDTSCFAATGALTFGDDASLTSSSAKADDPRLIFVPRAGRRGCSAFAERDEVAYKVSAFRNLVLQD